VGKHIARANCSPLLKYEIDGVFRDCGPDGETTVIDGAISKANELTPGELFYSDVNSATRREFLLNTISYRDVNYSEDMAFARDLLEAGYRKAYAATAVVEHSNDVTFSEYGKRIFDETLGMRRPGEERQSNLELRQSFEPQNVLVCWGKIIRMVTTASGLKNSLALCQSCLCLDKVGQHSPSTQCLAG
jgi:rhamnosyltransferase